MGTFLKAFRGAPGWTMEEIDLATACFNDTMGLIRKKKANPRDL